jgi:small subunit ribosomal protein S20
MADEKKEKAKVKKPSPLKRDEQSVKRNLRNRSFKSKFTTAVRSFEETLSKKEASAVKTKLSDIYSLMDKGVKKGIYKLNKASRVKSRFEARAKQVSA